MLMERLEATPSQCPSGPLLAETEPECSGDADGRIRRRFGHLDVLLVSGPTQEQVSNVGTNCPVVRRLFAPDAFVIKQVGKFYDNITLATRSTHTYIRLVYGVIYIYK